MSTIKVDNIRIASESVSRPVTGVAASWANVNGVGTVSIRGGLNSSSIVDRSVGRYAVSLTTYLASINSSATAEGNAGIGQFNRVCSVMLDYNDAVELTCFNTDDNQRIDLNYVMYQVHGGLE